MKLDFISARGAALPLVGNENFKLLDVVGLTQTKTSFSTSTVPTMDGDFINNAQAQPRGIVLYLEIKDGKNVEDVKRYILDYVKPKQTGALIWDQNGRRFTISGTVENIEMPRFVKRNVMQISIYCSQPYWEDLNSIIMEINLIMDLHRFEVSFPDEGIPLGAYSPDRAKTFTNTGDVAVGMTIKIVAIATVTNPIIYNVLSGEFFGISDTLTAGDEIVITTYKGNKSVTKNGANALSKITRGSTWLQLETGDNGFRVESDDESRENMYFTISFKQRYV